MVSLIILLLNPTELRKSETNWRLVKVNGFLGIDLFKTKEKAEECYYLDSPKQDIQLGDQNLLDLSHLREHPACLLM